MAPNPKYAPAFKIRINEQDLPAAVRAAVTSVRYQDGRNAADRVEIGLANPDLRWLQTHIRGFGFRPFPTRGPRGFFRSFLIVLRDICGRLIIRTISHSPFSRALRIPGSFSLDKVYERHYLV